MAKKTTRRKKTAAPKRASARRGGMAHWYVLGAAVIGGIFYMDSRGPGPESPATAIRTASIERKEKKAERETVPAATRVDRIRGQGRSGRHGAKSRQDSARAGKTRSRRFTFVMPG